MIFATEKRYITNTPVLEVKPGSTC